MRPNILLSLAASTLLVVGLSACTSDADHPASSTSETPATTLDSEPSEAPTTPSEVDSFASISSETHSDEPTESPDSESSSSTDEPPTTIVSSSSQEIVFGLESCEEAVVLDTFMPFVGCGHEVEQPRGIRDIRPSCGAPVADDERTEPRFTHIAFASADAARDVTFSWVTGEENRHTVVQLGTDPENLDQEHFGYSFTYRALLNEAPWPRVIHEIHVCGLEPATTYWYRVGGPGAWSDVYQFTTGLPVGSDEEYTFAVTGDTRNPTNEPWANALEQIAGFAPDFHLFSGDAVESGFVQAQWDSWFTAGEPWMAEQFFLPANGNHDLMALPYLAHFALPGDEENYYFRYGNGLFILVNDFPIQSAFDIQGPTRDFIEATLQEHADATWKVVVHHRAIYSASNHGSTGTLQEHWQPLYDEHGVDFVFNGHDHNYERTHPVRNGAVVDDGEGTVYVVAAGIGAPLYGNGNEWWTAISERTENYAIVNVRGNTFELNAYRLDGTLIDTYTLTKD